MSRTEKVDAALASLKTGMADLITSDAWTQYLTCQAKFHTYSPNNVMLIMSQCPTASRVAGYKAWQKLGRNVRKGEKGLMILAPMRRSAEDKNTGELRSWIGGFTGAYVWDISQTDGEPLPEPAAILDGAGDEALRLALVAQIHAAGFTCTDGDAETYGAGANGFTDFTARRVVIGASLPAAQRVKTTAHELAHVLLHSPDATDQPSRSVAEVEAESVAYVVLHAAGIDSGAYSLGYVAGWSGSDVKVVESVTKRVGRTARTILAAVEEVAA